ncbi:MAG: hypothetical protein ABIO05_00795 [Ferruginibacter sp.]
MKISHYLSFLILLAGYSCSPDEPPAAPGSTNYMSLTAGSTRTYTFTNITPPTATSNYTLTATNRDTAVAGRSYKVFTSSNGASEYYAVAGNDYYVYQAIAPTFGNTSVEILYLKDNVAVNTTWAQTTTVNVPGVPFPVTLNLSNKIIEKGIGRTVNGISYSDVIHVKRDITASISGLPVTGLTTDMHYYYAPKVGLIENNVLLNLNFMGITNNTNTQTKLQSANIL